MRIGQELGHYRILQKLGSGGMGEVYLSEDTRLGRRVALKILSPEVASQPRHRERFEREARSVAALNHPNIVTIHSVEEADGIHLLAMELVEGETLSSLIPPGGLPLERLVEIALPLCQALTAAHSKGLIHRDLKPDNVMVSREGRVKILDFGIAKLQPDHETTLVAGTAPDLTVTGTVVGTAPYMSPEQVRGWTLDHRTDIFSLGVVLYEMAAGQRPFKGATRTDCMAAILRDSPPKPSAVNRHLPRRFDDIVERCLAKEPGQRFQSASQVEQELLTLFSPTRPIELLPQSARSLRVPVSWKRLAAIAATALLLLTAIPLGRLFKNPPSQEPVSSPRAGSPLSASPPSLAVLPLGNLSNDPEYFVDGMTDALIATLADVRGVRVISRQSVMRFKSSEQTIPEIADELGVEMIVAGAVLRAGDRVRITAQLVRAVPEQQVWAESYERDLRDILALQREVAQAITEEIKGKLQPQDLARAAGEENVAPAAYDAYLQGLYHLNKRSWEGFQKAIHHFQQAIAISPGFAAAYTGLADSYSLAGYFGMEPPGEAFLLAKEAATKALALDPNLAGAHASLGFVQFFYDWNWAAAEKSFRRALELNSNNATAHYFFWSFLSAMGRFDEGLEQIRLAYELDPLSPMINANLGLQYYFMHRDEEALACFHRAMELEPTLYPVQVYLFWLYNRQEKADLAYQHYRKALQVRGYSGVVSAMDRAYAERGREDALRESARHLSELARQRRVSIVDAARPYATLGDTDQAMVWLEQAYKQRAPFLAWAGESGEWDNIRREPRFQKLLRQIGLLDRPRRR